MSSILEALRKSDDKRQQGTAKGVDQIQFSEKKPEKESRKGFYALVFLLLVVAVTVWAYQQGYLAPVKSLFVTQDEAAGKEIDSTVVLEPAPKSKNGDNGSVVALKPPAPKNIKEQINNHISEQKEKKGEFVSLTDSKNTLTEVDGGGKKQGNMPVIENRTKSSDRLVIDGEPVSKKTAKNIKPDSENDKNNRITTPNDETQLQIANKEGVDKGSKNQAISINKKTDQKRDQKRDNNRDKSRNKNSASTAKQAYLLVHQLPFEIRKELPELKVNVHVFDPEPENRMVVINGESFQVGEGIEEIATVKDITADGVVIEVAGTVFLIPK